MSDQGGVFSILGNTFSHWASFRESRNKEVVGLFARYISDRPFVVFAVPVESPAVQEFAKYLKQRSNLSISNIDGDPYPNALWIGHWTHFTVKESGVQAPLVVPPSLSQSEKYFQQIQNGINRRKRQPRR